MSGLIPETLVSSEEKMYSEAKIPGTAPRRMGDPDRVKSIEDTSLRPSNTALRRNK